MLEVVIGWVSFDNLVEELKKRKIVVIGVIKMLLVV